MQALSCIISTMHGLGIIVVMGLMCLCRVCVELLLIFYLFYQLLAGWPSSKLFRQIFPVGVECHLFTLYSGRFAWML